MKLCEQDDDDTDEDHMIGASSATRQGPRTKWQIKREMLLEMLAPDLVEADPQVGRDTQVDPQVDAHS